MSIREPIEIPATEHGVLRLFALDMRPEQAAFLRDEPGALAQILGVADLDMAQADLFAVSDLEEMGVIGYLHDGCGVTLADLEPDRDRLQALEGQMLLLRSRAFGGTDTRLTPASQVSLVATYSEAAAKWSAAQLTADTAKPERPNAARLSPRQARADARRIGFIFFAVVMSLILMALAAIVF